MQINTSNTNKQIITIIIGNTIKNKKYNILRITGPKNINRKKIIKKIPIVRNIY